MKYLVLELKKVDRYIISFNIQSKFKKKLQEKFKIIKNLGVIKFTYPIINNYQIYLYY